MSSTYYSKSPQDVPDSSEHVDEYPDSEKNYQPRSPKFWMILLGMYASIFLVALDRLIIVTAIPAITNEFDSIEDIAWYGSAYMLTAAIFNPSFGRIYQQYSTRWVFLISLVIFEAGSALCGAAPNSTAFIIGRAIAGIGCSGIFVGGTMIIIPIVPLRKRPAYISLFGLAFGVSSVLGPLIGGTFSDNPSLTWRWCFYINLPIGGFTFLAVFLFFRVEEAPRKKSTMTQQFNSLDPIGLLLLAPSLVALFLALEWGGTTYTWSSSKIIGLLVTFAVLFVAFLAVEVLLPDTAMAPTRVVLNRSVGGGLIFLFLIYGGMMVAVYYLGIWFQAAQGTTAMQAGIRTLPFVLALVVSTIVSAAFTQTVGYYVPAMLVAPCLCAVGAGMLSTLTPSSGSNQWIGYQVIYGIGVGIAFQNCTLIPQVVLSPADVPLGMAMMFFMQQLGGAVFIPVGQNIFSSQLVKRIGGFEGANAQDILNAGATAYRNIVPAVVRDEVIRAYSKSLTQVFIVSAALSAFMIFGALMVEWKNIKTKKDPAPAAETSETGEREKNVQTEA